MAITNTDPQDIIIYGDELIRHYALCHGGLWRRALYLPLNPVPDNYKISPESKIYKIEWNPPEERDAVEQLVKEAYQEFRPLFTPDIWERWLDNLSRAIHSEEGILLVVESAGILQGAVKFYPDASQAGLGHWPPGSASMRVLAVRPGSRMRGYGRLLVAECLRLARELGIARIYLYTGVFMDAARRLYEKLGFVRAEEFDRDPGPIAYRLDLGEG